MTHLTFTNNGKTYKQISKPMAMKMYCKGKTVFACPSNIRPFNNPWCGVFDINIDDVDGYDKEFRTPQQNFEIVTNSIIYYNCNNETGRYLRFYAEF